MKKKNKFILVTFILVIIIIAMFIFISLKKLPSQKSPQEIEIKGILEHCQGESLCENCNLGYTINTGEKYEFFTLYSEGIIKNQNVPGALENFVGKTIILKGHNSKATHTNSPCAYLFVGKEISIVE